ncbi:hypothetical protein GCM10027298_23780 [Epidermidibacterium keratini]|nr:hypothetical protein [Epidermidibacterium keratini]
MALLGNAPDAYGQTWHLPVDPNRLTYKGIIEIASELLGRKVPYSKVPLAAFKLGALINSQLKEASELLPRYAADNIFDSSKFARRFPDFKVTSYRDGIATILK